MAEKIESLDELTRAELLAVAEQFGTEVKASTSKKDLLARLEEDGVDAELYNESQQTEEEYDAKALGLHPLAEGEELEHEVHNAAEEADEEDLVLVKMTRKNGTYQVRGYTFKRDHPYVLVTESDADYLIEVEGGFAMCSPLEVKEYYS